MTPKLLGRRWRHSAGLSLVLSAASVAVPVTAAETPIRADPHQISELMKSEKYPVELKTDSEGTPYISSEREDRSYQIYFYGCDEGVRNDNCTSVQFYSAFTTGKPFPLERINKWSTERRFGRAYVESDGDAAIEMDVNFASTGMSRELFLDNLDLWFEVFGLFDAYVFEEPEQAPDGKSVGAPAAD